MRFLALICLLSAVPVSAGEFAVKRIAPDAAAAQSGAVRVEHADLLFSAQVFSTTEGGFEKQLPAVIDQANRLLRSAGLKFTDVVKLNVYLTENSQAAEVAKALSRQFKGASLPAVSWVTTALPEETADPKKKATVAIDFVAARAPSPTAPVVPAAVDGQRQLAVIPASATSRVYISGQAEKGDGSVADATKQTMASLVKTLKFLELSQADVVQVKAFLTPMSKSADAIKEIRKAFAPAAAPPIVLVEWQSPSLPIEIELIAATRIPLDNSRPVVEYLAPPELKHSPVYSRIARVQSPATIFLSGVYGTQSDADSEAELRQMFDITKSLAEEAGSDLKHLVKATYYVSSANSSQQHNELRPEYYDPARPPAASKAIVKGVGREGRTITWDMIAVPKE